MALHPHCDSRVLHAPAACEYCDLYPDRQRDRTANGINFTGESDPTKQPCPADLARGSAAGWPNKAKGAHVWPGNQPCDATHKAAQDQYFEELRRALRGEFDTEPYIPADKFSEDDGDLE